MQSRWTQPQDDVDQCHVLDVENPHPQLVNQYRSKLINCESDRLGSDMDNLSDVKVSWPVFHACDPSIIGTEQKPNSLSRDENKLPYLQQTKCHRPLLPLKDGHILIFLFKQCRLVLIMGTCMWSMPDDFRSNIPKRDCLMRRVYSARMGLITSRSNRVPRVNATKQSAMLLPSSP